jgi:hypothetical protein
MPNARNGKSSNTLPHPQPIKTAASVVKKFPTVKEIKLIPTKFSPKIRLIHNQISEKTVETRRKIPTKIANRQPLLSRPNELINISFIFFALEFIEFIG